MQVDVTAPDHEQAERVAEYLRGVEQDEQGPLDERDQWLASLAAQLAERERERNAALVALYMTDSLACAKLCDEHLDRRGALLGHVRDWATATHSDSEERGA